MYARNDKALAGMLCTTLTSLTFSSDIGMTFGIEKCAKGILKRGKQVCANNINLNQDLTIQELEQEANYK